MAQSCVMVMKGVFGDTFMGHGNAHSWVMVMWGVLGGTLMSHGNEGRVWRYIHIS